MDRTISTWKPYISENRQHKRPHKWSILAARRRYEYRKRYYTKFSMLNFGYVQGWIKRDYGTFNKEYCYGIRTH